MPEAVFFFAIIVLIACAILISVYAMWRDTTRLMRERYAVADHVVAQLKQEGDPWRLNDEATAGPPPTT